MASIVAPVASAAHPNVHASQARLVVGIGELAVSTSAHDVIVTHALGSCVAVCLWDPEAKIAGMLHLLLPDSRINPARAAAQPAAFADLGIPLLFQTAYRAGLDKKRCRVRLVGGAEIHGSGDMNVGRRNVLAAKNILWRNGVMVAGEETGGNAPRTVSLAAASGALVISTGGHAHELSL
jgi:chemotaxis protein CheD